MSFRQEAGDKPRDPWHGQPQVSEIALLLEGSQALPVHLSSKNNRPMTFSVEYWWNDTQGKREVFGENSLPVPVFPPQISH